MADWLDTEYMIVVNQDGTQHHYERVGGEMLPLAPIHNPAYVAGSDSVETLLADLAYWIQTLSEIGNPPEMVMRQGEAAEEEFSINTNSRLVDKFLLSPAAIVFLDDVATEYGVEDLSFFSAMVATIIYRELSARGSLENADNPAYQSNWDATKRFLNMIPYLFKRPMTFRKEAVVLAGQLDGDPSLGIGALSREAGKNIQGDAERLGMTMYFPALGYDRPTTLDHMPISLGEQSVIQRFFVGSLDPDIRVLRAVPPSNEDEGVWRVEIPRFEHGPLASLREEYEPTLGILAAEVAIAMRSTQYQDIKGDDKKVVEDRRIAFLIGNHANRSAVPRESLYNPEHFSEDTENEIQWARDFMELMDDTRTEIQSVS